MSLTQCIRVLRTVKDQKYFPDAIQAVPHVVMCRAGLKPKARPMLWALRGLGPGFIFLKPEAWAQAQAFNPYIEIKLIDIANPIATLHVLDTYIGADPRSSDKRDGLVS